MCYPVSQVKNAVSPLLLVLVLLTLAGGCVGQPPERMPRPEELLPPGYQERLVPPDLLKQVTPAARPTRFWMRGVVWQGDWAASTAQLDKLARELGYRRLRHSLVTNLEAHGLSQDDVYLLYESKHGTVKIGLLNIKLMRERGAGMETSADFLYAAFEDHWDYESPEAARRRRD